MVLNIKNNYIERLEMNRYKRIKIFTLMLLFSLSFGLMISCMEDNIKPSNTIINNNQNNFSPLPMQTISISVEGNGQKFPGLFGAFAKRGKYLLNI